MRVGEHYRTAKQLVTAPCPSSDPASRGHLPPGEGLGAVHISTSLEAPWCLRGRGPAVWERVQRKPFRRVSFGVFFLLRSVFFLGRPRKKMRRDQLVASTSNKMAPGPRPGSRLKALTPLCEKQTSSHWEAPFRTAEPLLRMETPAKAYHCRSPGKQAYYSRRSK